MNSPEAAWLGSMDKLCIYQSQVMFIRINTNVTDVHEACKPEAAWLLMYMYSLIFYADPRFTMNQTYKISLEVG